MKLLELTAEQRAAALGEDAEGRTGVFTSGIVSIGEGRKIVLFFTGVRHAGENLAEVLKRRAENLPIPIQMCDGSSSNTAGDFETLLSKCNAHGRRKFVELAELFPEQVRFVLKTLREVYKTDAAARTGELSPAERLRLHQRESAPRMAALKEWMDRQLTERLIEPNSRLGEAIRYLQNHWEGLTLFLRVEGTWQACHVPSNQKRTVMRRGKRISSKTSKFAAKRFALFQACFPGSLIAEASPCLFQNYLTSAMFG